MASTKYDKIKQLIVAKKAMSATYKGSARDLWPMVIGTSPKPSDPSQDIEIVLCYQFGGSATLGAGWRCFKINGLTSITEIVATGRPPMSTRKLARQSCVQDREIPA